MICAKCGTNNIHSATLCSACGTSLVVTAEKELVYAGFWKRFAALFIDGLLITVASVILILILALLTGGNSGLMVAMFYLLLFGLSAYYFVSMEAGPHSATWGKRWLNLKVLDSDGARLSTGRAFARWLAHGISNITFYIGYVMQPFTERKQALHDIVSATVVVDESPDSRSGTLAIVLVVGGVGVIAMLGIVAAIAIPAYSTYVGKAQVVQAYSQALNATQQLDRYFAANGKLPDTQAIANLPDPAGDTATLHYDEQAGHVIVTFAPDRGVLAGRHLDFTPTLLIDNTLEWKCSSKDIRPELLVTQCK